MQNSYARSLLIYPRKTRASIRLGRLLASDIDEHEKCSSPPSSSNPTSSPSIPVVLRIRVLNPQLPLDPPPLPRLPDHNLIPLLNPSTFISKLTDPALPRIIDLHAHGFSFALPERERSVELRCQEGGIEEDGFRAEDAGMGVGVVWGDIACC